MNPVLKKAGVVDAGGKGYLVILEGMLRPPCGARRSRRSEEQRGGEGGLRRHRR